MSKVELIGKIESVKAGLRTQKEKLAELERAGDRKTASHVRSSISFGFLCLLSYARQLSRKS